MIGANRLQWGNIRLVLDERATRPGLTSRFALFL